jgi:integrase
MDELIKFSLKEANQIIKTEINNLANSLRVNPWGKTPGVFYNGGSLVIKFTYQGEQKTFVAGYSLDVYGINESRSLAIEIGKKLLLDQFSLAWLDSYKRKTKLVKRELDIFSLWCEYKEYFLNEISQGKLTQADLWLNRQGEQLDRLFLYKKTDFKNKYELSKLDIQWLINNRITKEKNKLRVRPDNTTRAIGLKKSMLKNFLAYIDQDHLFPLVVNKTPKRQFSQEYCTDQQIELAIATLENKIKNGKPRYIENNLGWLFFLKVVAIWGLRPHEFWNIKNWSNSVDLVKGDFVPGEKIKAINDPNNENKLLAIGGDTKTGSRLVLPMPPEGIELLEICNSEFYFPLVNDPLMLRQGSYNCTDLAGKFFKRNDLFNPYQLRHAYAHRCNRLGVNAKVASNSMGHSLNVHNATYLGSNNQDQQLADYQQELNKLNKKNDLIKKRLSELGLSDSQLLGVYGIIQELL